MSQTGNLAIHPPIDLQAALNGGQAFRWIPAGDGWYSGVIQDCLVNVRAADDGIEYRSNRSIERTRPILENYFRLDDDIESIHVELSRDPILAQLIRKYAGLRLLRQDPWECLVAYLCSANNNIQQISRICERLSEAFGAELTLGPENRNTFPTAADLVRSGLNELRSLRLGLERADNIFGLALEVQEGLLDLEKLRESPTHEAKERLLEVRGIGDKIAGCVLLFSLDKLDAFPIDRHISRALAEEYFPGLGLPTNSELPLLESLFNEHFGQYAGYAGQFLFHDMLQNSGR